MIFAEVLQNNRVLSEAGKELRALQRHCSRTNVQEKLASYAEAGKRDQERQELKRTVQSRQKEQVEVIELTKHINCSRQKLAGLVKGHEEFNDRLERQHQEKQRKNQINEVLKGKQLTLVQEQKHCKDQIEEVKSESKDISEKCSMISDELEKTIKREEILMEKSKLDKKSKQLLISQIGEIELVNLKLVREVQGQESLIDKQTKTMQEKLQRQSEIIQAGKSIKNQLMVQRQRNKEVTESIQESLQISSGLSGELRLKTQQMQEVSSHIQLEVSGCFELNQWIVNQQVKKDSSTERLRKLKQTIAVLHEQKSKMQDTLQRASQQDSALRALFTKTNSPTLCHYKPLDSQEPETSDAWHPTT